MSLPEWRTSRALTHPGCHFHLCALCEGAIGGFYDQPCPAWNNEDHVAGICYDCWQFVKADKAIETAVGSYTPAEILGAFRWPAEREAHRAHLTQRMATARTEKERRHWERFLS